MKTTTPVLLVLVSGLAACAAPGQLAPLGLGFAQPSPPMRLIESPSVRPPANDISEAQRREWFDAQRPTVEYQPVREVYVEREPVRYVRDYDYGYDRGCGWGGWLLPLSLSLGYWSGGHGHGHGGWGWGIGTGFGGGWCH